MYSLQLIWGHQSSSSFVFFPVIDCVQHYPRVLTRTVWRYNTNGDMTHVADSLFLLGGGIRTFSNKYICTDSVHMYDSFCQDNHTRTHNILWFYQVYKCVLCFSLLCSSLISDRIWSDTSEGSILNSKTFQASNPFLGMNSDVLHTPQWVPV